MNSALELVKRIESAGGVLALKDSERIMYDLPTDMVPLLVELRARKGEVVQVLRQREEIPDMPPGVHLISWNLKEAPIAIEACSIVTNPAVFARTTLQQLRAALAGKRHLAGNWTIRDLVDRLEQVGVKVEVDECKG